MPVIDQSEQVFSDAAATAMDVLTPRGQRIAIRYHQRVAIATCQTDCGPVSRPMQYAVSAEKSAEYDCGACKYFLTNWCDVSCGRLH